MDDVFFNTKSRKVRIGILALVLIIVGAVVGGVIAGQKELRRRLKTIKNWLGKSSLQACTQTAQFLLSKLSRWAMVFVTVRRTLRKQCGLDHGDCDDCKVDDRSRIGDGVCDGGIFNTEECGWDGRDCLDEAKQELLANLYPNCAVPPSKLPRWAMVFVTVRRTLRKNVASTMAIVTTARLTIVLESEMAFVMEAYSTPKSVAGMEATALRSMRCILIAR